MTDEEKKEEAKRRAIILMSLKKGYKPKVTMTAVEWLEKQLDIDLVDNGWYFEKAKEMEKQQIIDAFLEGCSDNNNDGFEYYNLTFKSE